VVDLRRPFSGGAFFRVTFRSNGLDLAAKCDGTPASSHLPEQWDAGGNSELGPQLLIIGYAVEPHWSLWQKAGNCHSASEDLIYVRKAFLPQFVSRQWRRCGSRGFARLFEGISGSEPRYLVNGRAVS